MHSLVTVLLPPTLNIKYGLITLNSSFPVEMKSRYNTLTESRADPKFHLSN